LPAVKINPVKPNLTLSIAPPLGNVGRVRRPAHRWWIYQRERFPVAAHGALIAAFSFSAVSFSSLLRNHPGFPSAASIFTAFATAFILFLQLRIADEFKDFDEDFRYQPERPVPRGLVKLRELGVIAVAGAVLQLVCALSLAPSLVFLLILTWAYLGLMTREFFVRAWIRERPITYLWSHMLIIPLADFYATACDWRGAGVAPPSGLFWFISVSFFNGVVLEIGRKIRAPGEEKDGVRTYSRLWGRLQAVLAWLGALLISAICAALASAKIGFLQPLTIILGLLLSIAAFLAWRFLSSSSRTGAKLLEHFSGLWTLMMYLSLGAMPLLWRLVWGSR
jgi:UbiA prenyltransferase family